MNNRRDYSGEFINTCKGTVPLNKALDIVKYYPDEDIMLGLYAYAADHQDNYVLRTTRAAQKRLNQPYNPGPVASPNNLPRGRMNTEPEEEQAAGNVLDNDVAMKYWRLLQEYRFVDEKRQLLAETTRKQAMCIAEMFAEKLGLKAKWKTFEMFWNIKNLAQEKYDLQEKGLLPSRYKEMELIFSD